MKSLLLSLVLCGAACGQGPNHDLLQITRWREARVSPNRQREVELIVDRIVRNAERYRAVSSRTAVPWHVIAGLHNMESSLNFTRHLHEGSSLRWRTRDVPKGRPKPPANPPFTWEFSALDALTYDRMGEKKWSDLGKSLSACEGYNGWGYAKYHPATPTPYLYGGTAAARPGKYVSDGVWSSTAWSSQIGIAALWKELERRKLVVIPAP